MGSVARTRRLRGLAVTAIGLAVVAGAALVASSEHLSSPAALALGLALGLGLSVVGVWLRERRRRRERGAAREAQRARRREAAYRVFWQAGADLGPDGWARRDLEALRLVARNLRPDEPLGERMARRVRETSSAVLARVIDRLADLVVAGRRIGISESRLGALEQHIERLAAQLEQAKAVASEPPPFDPATVVGAVESVASLVDQLRESVRPQIVADLVTLAERFARDARSGFEHELNLRRQEARPHLEVAVRESDLAAAFEALFERLMSRGRVSGPVDLELRHQGGSALFAVHWTIGDRLRVDPGDIAEPLRVLVAYGAEVAVDEDVQNERMTVELALPLAVERVAN